MALTLSPEFRERILLPVGRGTEMLTVMLHAHPWAYNLEHTDRAKFYHLKLSDLELVSLNGVRLPERRIHGKEIVLASIEIRNGIKSDQHLFMADLIGKNPPKELLGGMLFRTENSFHLYWPKLGSLADLAVHFDACEDCGIKIDPAWKSLGFERGYFGLRIGGTRLPPILVDYDPF